MRRALLLGLRLTGGGAGPARMRSVFVAVAAAVGTALLLAVAAVARAEAAQDAALYGAAEMRRLLLAVVLTVALPVLVLAATAGRLSAELRDRRLANLRLLGLTPLRTRLVAVAETGVATVVGAVAGLLLFLATRPLLASVSIAGRHWSRDSLAPMAGDYVLVLVGLPIVVVAVASLPQRLDMAAVLSRTRRADARRPSPFRVLPVLVGAALCGYAQLQPPGTEITGPVLVALFAGVGLLALGLVLVVPVLVRLLADLVLRVSPGPSGVIAARRLQAQPVGITRVVAGLLIGLFLVTGARSVVVAFEGTPQYQQAERQVTDGQRVAVTVPPGKTDRAVRRAREIEGVRRVVALPRVDVGCTGGRGVCLQGIVATCAQLELVVPAVTGCRDGEVTWLIDEPDLLGDQAAAGGLTWRARREDPARRREAPTFHSRVPVGGIGADIWSAMQPVDATVLVPPSLPGVAQVVRSSPTELLVLADPGRDLLDRLQAAGLGANASYWSFEDYDFVAGLRALVWAIAAVVLAVGLLAFAVAAVDRAIARRREVASLQVVGVPARTLRRVQWVEAALPIGLGTVLAIGLGLLAGSTYLALGDEGLHAPYQQSAVLALVGCLGAAAVAGLTVLAGTPRIRPDLIRAE